MDREYKSTEDKKNRLNIFPHQTIFIDRLYKINKNWLMNFSLEIGPKTDIDTLPELKDVYKCPACGMITNERLDDR